MGTAMQELFGTLLLLVIAYWILPLNIFVGLAVYCTVLWVLPDETFMNEDEWR